jgi:hypothetical protein
MLANRHPLRVLEHALTAGDQRLAELITARLFPDAAPAAYRTFLLLRQRLAI